MNLADHILASKGSIYDVCGMVTSMATTVEKAERFEMSDDVIRAAHSLLDTKPSTLNAALPMCRLPYPDMWIEYRGGLGVENKRDPALAPVPERQGFLIESPPDAQYAGQVGFATVTWTHRRSDPDEHAVSASPFAIYFDWRPDGDVAQIIRNAHRLFLTYAGDELQALVLKSLIKWIEFKFLTGSTTDELRQFFGHRHGWEKFVNDPREIEAMRISEAHMSVGLSFHGLETLVSLMGKSIELNDQKTFSMLAQNWLTDISGEGVVLECMLAMLNSRNCVEREPVDLSRLNKARGKRGKLPLLDYTKTKLVLSRARARAMAASGIERDAARQHLVRGHFKIRKTGVYWWSPFVRGDAVRGKIKRAEYEVT